MKRKKITEENSKEKIDKIILWKDVAKDEYIIRRKEIDSVDNKLLYMLLFNFTVFALFLQFIKMPEGIYGNIFYILNIVLYFLSIILLIWGLSPKKINTINFNPNEKNDIFDELRILKYQYDIASEKNSKVIDSKLYFLIVSIVSFLIAVFFTMIIKTIQQV